MTGFLIEGVLSGVLGDKKGTAHFHLVSYYHTLYYLHLPG